MDQLSLYHYYFDELGYRPKSLTFSFGAFLSAVIDTLNHAATTEDAYKVLSNYASVAPMFQETMRLANQNKSFWMSIPWKGTCDINLISDKESLKYVYFTNVFTGDVENISFCGLSLPKVGKRNGLFSIDKEQKKFFVKSKKEPRFFLNSTQRKQQPAFLVLDGNLSQCGLLRLNSYWRPVVDNNQTEYEILVNPDNKNMVFYKRDYYESHKEEGVNRKNALAIVSYNSWFVAETGDFDNDYDIYLSRMELLDSEAKNELLFLYASSIILLDHKTMENKRFNKYLYAIAPKLDDY